MNMKTGELFNPCRDFRVFRHVVRAVQRDQNMSYGPKALYLALCFYAGANGRCFPHQKALAYNLAASLSAVERYVHTLRERGYLEAKSSGRGRSYCFLWHESFNAVNADGYDGQHPSGMTGDDMTPIRNDGSDPSELMGDKTTPIRNDGSDPSELMGDSIRDLKELDLKNLSSSATPPTPPATTPIRNDGSTTPIRNDGSEPREQDPRPPIDTGSRIDLFINTGAKGCGFHVSQFTSKQLQWLLDQDSDPEFRERVLEVMGQLDQQGRCGNQREPLLRLLGQGMPRRQGMGGSLGRSSGNRSLSGPYGGNSRGRGRPQPMPDPEPDYGAVFAKVEKEEREKKEGLRTVAGADRVAQRKISDRGYRQSAGLEPSDVPLTETEREKIREQWRAEAVLQDRKEAGKLALEEAKKDADRKLHEENIARVKMRHPLQDMLDAEKARKPQGPEAVN